MDGGGGWQGLEPALELVLATVGFHAVVLFAGLGHCADVARVSLQVQQIVSRRSLDCRKRSDGGRPTVGHNYCVDIKSLEYDIPHVVMQVRPVEDNGQNKTRVMLVVSGQRGQAGKQIRRNSLH